MRKFAFLFLIIFTNVKIYSQTYIISFVATGEITILDSVLIENLTNPATVICHSGDILQLKGPNGINDLGLNDENLKVYPNPMLEQSEISFYAKQPGNTYLTISDITGKEVLKTEGKLLQGSQRYQLSGLKKGMYFLNISGGGYFYNSKLISQNTTSHGATIKYIGVEKPQIAINTSKSTKATITMPYIDGDSLRFTGYAGSYSAIVNDIVTSAITITFTFTAPLLNFVQIPAGTFTMGSPTSEDGHFYDETQHQVTLSAFRMSKYEITNAQYAAFLNAKSIGSNGKYAAGAYPGESLIYASHIFDWGLHYTNSQWVPVADYENHPVICVTWFGANDFATYAGGRLPTEAEWEYACRATTTSPFNTGSCLTNTQANYDWSYPYTNCAYSSNFPYTTQAVGTYAANAYGLHDMHGNVLEWCSDRYGPYPTMAQTNPTGPTTGVTRVFRGGYWSSFAPFCRSAWRDSDYPNDYFYGNVGFRVVLAP